MTTISSAFSSARQAAFGALVVAASLASTGAVAAERADMVPEIDWATPLRHFQIDNDKFIGQRLLVRCGPQTETKQAQEVYGSDVYSSKSAICPAAAHAGAISTKGGLVTVQIAPGQDAYKGGARNGVEAKALPKNPRSILFVTERSAAEADSMRREFAPRLSWDDKFTATGLANRNLVGQRFTFECPKAPGRLTPRKMFGTDVYAFHSVVCRAAVHAGAITMEGGMVTVQLNEGVDRLVGSERNGVVTTDGPGGDRTLVFVE